MIALLITDVPFEQDIRELFMAFYPGKGYIYVDDPAAEIRFTADAGELPACAGASAADFAVAEAGLSAADFAAPETAPEAEDETAEGVYRMTLDAGGRSYDFSSVRYRERLWSKNALKRALYRTLCEENGRTLPWGTLTGIRPACRTCRRKPGTACRRRTAPSPLQCRSSRSPRCGRESR